MAESVVVDRLGASADGIAETEGGRLYVAGTLPGERVLVERTGERGTLLAVETASPERSESFCRYYGRCGGCSAQHLGPDLYARWKREIVVTALRRAGLDAEPESLVDAHGAGRRRITVHARAVDGRPAVGFMAARSHALVPIDACPITVPALAGAPVVARALAAAAGVGKPLDIAVTASADGLDVDLRGSGPFSDPRRQALVAEALRLDLARLSRHGEVLVERRRPRIRFGDVPAVPPPGGFLQATEAGEGVLAEAVLGACRGARRVLDLFAGSGPFTLRLARDVAVHAVELDRAALASLDAAVRASSGLRPVTTEARDLFRRPLLAPELAPFDAVVLDPPRAGAESQARLLAMGSPETVILVSCDPGTFARDAAILVAGGLRLERVLPVDQFKWSAHVEIVGVFRRPRGPRRGARRR